MASVRYVCSELFRKKLGGGIILAGVACAACGLFACAPLTKSGFAQTLADGKSARALQRAELRKKILALPEHRYHEETRDSFAKRLVDADLLQKNLRAGPNELHCPGDGSAAAKDFSWSEREKVLTVRVHEADGMPARTDRWRRDANGWKLI